MESLKNQYNQIVSEKKELIKQISVLEENEKVKKYFELCSKRDKLASKQEDLYRQIKIEEYSSCNHIWVNILHDYDFFEERSSNYYGCVKCGLDKSVFHLMERNVNLDWLPLDQRIMFGFLKNHSYRTGVYTNLLCDFDLAKAIYSKIKEAHPDIDDATTIKYFEVALHNIRNIKVSEERKVSRAERLSLNSNFNKWD